MKRLLFLIAILCLSNISYFYANNEPEVIYGIMITGKDEMHYYLAHAAVQSFLEQTYPNKHLIIINDGKYSLDYLNEQITEIKLEQKLTLGQLRNKGLQQVPENCVWIQWDDDDWHHPEIIEKQYNFLTAKKRDLCLLKNQVQYAFKKNAAWCLSRGNGIPGTIMCRKKRDVWYPKKAKGEDSIFLKNYKRKYKTVVWSNPDYYYLRFIHGYNTWNDRHFALYKRKNDVWQIRASSKKYLEKILPIYEFLNKRVEKNKLSEDQIKRTYIKHFIA